MRGIQKLEDALCIIIEFQIISWNYPLIGNYTAYNFHLITSLKHRGHIHFSIVSNIHFTCGNRQQESKLISSD